MFSQIQTHSYRQVSPKRQTLGDDTKEKFREKWIRTKPLITTEPSNYGEKAAAVKIIKNAIWQCFLVDWCNYLNCTRGSDGVLMRRGRARTGAGCSRSSLDFHTMRSSDRFDHRCKRGAGGGCIWAAVWSLGCSGICWEWVQECGNYASHNGIEINLGYSQKLKLNIACYNNVTLRVVAWM